MSVAIYFHGATDGDDGPFDLASTGGWTAFARWIEALPSSKFPALRRLVEDGEAKGTDRLSAELGEVKPNGSVAATAAALAELVGVGDVDETATIGGA